MTEGVFIGRGAALDVLDAAWARVGSGASAVVWIEGEPGVGKTSLVRRFTRSLGDATVVWVTADEDEARHDLGVLTELLRRLDPNDATGSDVAATAEDRRGRHLLDALTGFDAPTVLVVDDLQWVDPPSLAALRFALRRLESDGVLVVLTTDLAGEQTLGDTWQRFLLDPHLVTHHHLSGLTADELVELADALGSGRLDDASAERLRAHTDGNALHAIALVTELGTDGLVAAVPVLPSPRSFAEVTRSRLASLDGPARALVQAGSVLGASFRLGDAAHVGGIADPSAALDAAVRSGLLRSPVSGSVTFEHPLVRGAVYNDLAPTRRRTLHRAAVAVTTGITWLVHRVEATDRPDDELAAEIEAVAGAEIARGDVSRGADLLLMAARVAASPVAGDQLVSCAVESLVAGAHLTRALTLEPRVAACAPSAHRDHVLALLDMRQGRLESARVRFLAAADAAAETGPTSTRTPRTGDVRARALAGAAFVDWFTGDATSALALANESLAGDVGWGGSLVCYVRAMALVHLGRVRELETRPLPERLPEPFGPIDRLAVTGAVNLYLDDLEAAATDLAAAVDLGRNAASSQLFAMALSILAEAELRRGRWDTAMIDAELAIAFATDASGMHALIQGHTVAVEVAAGRGRFDDAQAHLDAASELATVLPAWGARTRIAMAGAALAIARDDRRALVAAGAELTGGDLSNTLGALPTWRWRATVAEAHLAACDLGAAQAAVDQLADVVETRGWEHASASAKASLVRLRGRLARAHGDEQAALAEYGRVAPHPDGSGPLPVARVLIDHGELLLHVGRAPDAVSILESAERILAGLGAAAFQVRCHRLLTECGVAIDLARPDPLAALTPRQEAVALLVADNLTNKEIAAELIVGLKTVEYHLSQIFTRLDLHSRRDLADLVRRRRGAQLRP